MSAPSPLPVLPVEVVLPHKPPMRLLDAILGWEGETLTCARTVPSDDPFLEDGALPALALLECMAQGVAAHRGLVGLARGEPIRIGFLVGCRELRLHVDAVAVGDALRIVVEPRSALGPMASYAARTCRGDQILAEALIQVAVKEDP